jgi:hypothetical protein
MCVPPTCSDGVLNQGEEGIDSGGPCAFIRISGFLEYEEADAFTDSNTPRGFKPIRFASVSLMRNGPVMSSYIDSVLSQNDGFFEFIVPRNNLDEINDTLFLQINPDNYAARVEKDWDWCNEYVSWYSINRFKVPSTGNTINLGTLQVGMNANINFNGSWKLTGDCLTWPFAGEGRGNIIGGSAYFNIAETILLTRIYVDSPRINREDQGIGRIYVAYPDNGPVGFINGGTPWENPIFDEIYLPSPNAITGNRDTGFSDDTIIHEYTHHISVEISENYWALSPHTLCTYVAIGSRKFAWFEGYATFMANFMLNRHTITKDPDWWLSQEGNNYEFAETPWCGVNAEIEDEDVTIFQIFDTELENDPADICHFIYGPLGWKSIFNREGDPRANAIDPILVNYNITCSGV